MEGPMIILAGLVLLLLAALVHAQDGWVLWAGSRSQATWEAKGTFESFAECTGERENVIQAVLASAGSGTRRTGHTIVHPGLGAPRSTEYVCLPDTTDPKRTK
jgi:hypothetical protein